MADFAYVPDFGWNSKPSFGVLRSKFENGVEQRRLKRTTKLRTFELVFNNRSAAEMTAVLSFFDSKYESLTAFSISINGVDVTGIIAQDTFVYDRTGPNQFNYSFRFEEQIS